MWSRTHLLSLLSLASVAAACAPPPIAEQPKEPAKNHGFTKTWIEVVGSMGWPTAEECEQANEWLKGESECEGLACRFAADISTDYVATCAEDMRSGLRAQAQERNAHFQAEMDKPPGSCMRTPIALLDIECNEKDKCADRAQTWATRCVHRTRSPLLVRYLTKRIRESIPSKSGFSLDVRSCDTLAYEIEDASECDDQFECKEALPKLKEFLDTCAEGNQSELSLTQAIHAYTLLQKTGKPDGVYVAEDKSQWQADKDPRVGFNGHTRLTKICDEPALFESAEQALGECKNGLIEFFAVKKDRYGGYMMRHARVPYVDEATSRLLMPWIWDADQRKVEFSEANTAMAIAVASLGQAAEDKGDWKAPFKDFLRATRTVDVSLISDEALAQMWSPLDKSLEKSFGRLGYTKANGVSRRASKPELKQLYDRSQNHPFSDLDPQLVVQLGVHESYAALDLSKHLPLSMEAYRKGLKSLKFKIGKYETSEADRAAAMKDTQMRCEDALGTRDHAQAAVRKCAFRAGACDPGPVVSNAEKVKGAYDQWHQAHLEAHVFGKNDKGEPLVSCGEWYVSDW